MFLCLLVVSPGAPISLCEAKGNFLWGGHIRASPRSIFSISFARAAAMGRGFRCQYCSRSLSRYVFETRAVASLPALGPWAPPAERGPSLESIYRVSLTVDLCEGNEIISLKKLFHHNQLGAPQKEKKIRGPWARAQCAHWLTRPWTCV